MKELTMHINPEEKKPLYQQIYEFLKHAIETGDIPAREKLPSTRFLSSYLEVSRSTVELAYEQLLAEGYMESIPCRGYYVCEIEGMYQFQGQLEGKKEQKKQEQSPYRYDFSPNGIDLMAFPYNTWRKVNKAVLQDDRNELFQLGDSRGEQVLRESIQAYLYQARGVHCHADQIILGAGNDYLLFLLSQILGRDSRIAMENPTYRHGYEILKELFAGISLIPMDAFGMQVKELAASGANLAYVMPSHQYPLGVVMPIGRRMELLRWADAQEGRYLIEDDYDSEFRYKGKPIPALQGTDRNGRVIYLGTFSRSIAPAIRISYMVLPEALLGAYEERGRHFSCTVSRIDQMVLHAFLQEGHYERHLNRMRTMYSRKHDLLLGVLKKAGLDFEVFGEHAGVHLLLRCKNHGTESQLVEKAEKSGIRVYPLSEYEMEGESKETHPVLILGYATLKEAEIKEAAEELLRAITG